MSVLGMTRLANKELIALKDSFLLAQSDLGKIVDRVMAERATKALGVKVSAQFVSGCRKKQSPPILSTYMANRTPQAKPPLSAISEDMLKWGRA